MSVPSGNGKKNDVRHGPDQEKEREETRSKLQGRSKAVQDHVARLSTTLYNFPLETRTTDKHVTIEQRRLLGIKGYIRLQSRASDITTCPERLLYLWPLWPGIG